MSKLRRDGHAKYPTCGFPPNEGIPECACLSFRKKGMIGACFVCHMMTAHASRGCELCGSLAFARATKIAEQLEEHDAEKR